MQRCATLNIHSKALPFLLRALGSLAPSVLANTGFCLCEEWNFSFCVVPPPDWKTDVPLKSCQSQATVLGALTQGRLWSLLLAQPDFSGHFTVSL